MELEVLSKNLSTVSSSLPLTVCLRNRVITGSSTISNQLGAGLIMVRAMNSICKLSLPLRVSMRSTHKHSQGYLMTVLGERCPYFSVYLLFIWQVLQDVVIEWMVAPLPFQCIAVFIVTLRRVCPGCCR